MIRQTVESNGIIKSEYFAVIGVKRRDFWRKSTFWDPNGGNKLLII